MTFSGEHAQSHQDVYDYNLYLDSLVLPRVFIDNMDKNVSHEDFLQKIVSKWEKEDSLLNDYRRVHPQMSDRAVAQLQMTHLNSFAFSLMQRKFTLDVLACEAFPESYMQKADSSLYMSE